MSVVLVVAAHPDDEVLGCGGTIAHHALKGDEVHVLLLAEGLTSREEARDRSRHADDLLRLSSVAEQANTLLGAKSVTTLDLPDNRMDSLDLLDIVKVVEKAFKARRPDVVYTHHAGDLNIDHGLTGRAVVTAARPQPGCSVRSLYFFEVPSSTDYQIPGISAPFEPNRFVDISQTLETKLEALKLYASEMRPWPHSRSLEAVRYLACSRGASIGIEAAEAFQVGRIIEP